MKKSKIKTEKEPWEFDGDDLDSSDPLYEISRPYRIWYEYLRLSPTFALAVKEYEYKYDKHTEQNNLNYINKTSNLFHEKRVRLLIQPELSDFEKERIPVDYSTVVKTFKEMTRLSYEFSIIDFKTWWNCHGQDIFGFRHNQLPVSIINVPANSIINYNEVIESLDKYTSKRWIKYESPSFELIAVPLTGNKDEVIKSLIELIKDKSFTPVKKYDKPLFKLENGKQLNKLEAGLRLIWIAATNPDLPLWKKGHKAKIFNSESYKKIDINLARQPKKNIENTELMASITSRKLKEALFIMENAARGIFPCNTPFKDPKYLKYKNEQILELVRESIERRKQVYNLQKQIDQWEDYLIDYLADEAKKRFDNMI
jgi:hypothetical protein